MLLYITRHGKTDWNSLGKWQGCADIPLNEEGKRQAESLRDRLASFKVEKIYSSDLQRAAHTAEIVNQVLRVPLELTASLREMSLGEWEGKTHDQLSAQYGADFLLWEQCLMEDGKYGVESIPRLQERAFAAIREITAKSSGNVLIVSHAAFTRALMCALLHIGLENRLCFDVANAGLNIVRYGKNDDSYYVLSLNDFSHTK